MDQLSRVCYELKFENNFLKLNGNSFQDYFSTIMEKRYPSDFIRVRPWGKYGDRKNDGYQKSTRTLFQVYAPNEMSASEAITKIDEDFNGALPYWKEYFNCWTFVHNASKDGIGPDILKKLLQLENDNKTIKICHWGYENLKHLVFELSESDIISLLGPVPSQIIMSSVGYENLKVVLYTIARHPPTNDVDLRPVLPDKIIVNALSENVEILLKAGMKKADLVEHFFEEWHDPLLGDEVAKAFNLKYNELKTMGLFPDSIFLKLQEFAGGDNRGDPGHEAAILAVLAYLFERCDIFERIKEV